MKAVKLCITENVDFDDNGFLLTLSNREAGQWPDLIIDLDNDSPVAILLSRSFVLENLQVKARK